MRFILYCSVCLISCAGVKAQNTYVSKIQEKANQLVAQTNGNYYPERMVKSLFASLDPCVNNLCRSSTLPVTLVRFEGKRVDEENVELFWETSEESNNDYFEVERTLNPTLGYTTIGKLSGAGSTSSTKKYRINDTNSFTDYTYYRLKQVDFDETFTYSSIVGIKPAVFPLSVITFPNPGQGKSLAFKIQGLKVSEQASIAIYDAKGVRIYADNKVQLILEEQVIRPSIPNVSPGKYTIKIKTNGRQAVNSFVVSP
ncbi:T9SS type A sorting domain-containing protein [Dyadobacter diqingensis]|uniref:T9SS type A sorting domain-containing protein n=1 Tax=Dyadobacter diqingensis TaxID=2938121 RepID=UPI0020C4E5FF|nr:T9SS type A sorting domain-containing protein [Dyadobacter diqingensis]